MTRDDIISMYEKANGWCPTEWDETVKDLERFAELVAAAEREACAEVAEQIEREVFNAVGDPRVSEFKPKIAAAIRARGLTSLRRQLIDAGALQSDPAGLKARGQK